MIPILLLALSLSPGDGLSLAPDAPPVPPPSVETPMAPSAPGFPLLPLSVAALGGLGVLGSALRRAGDDEEDPGDLERDLEAGDGDDPLVVFISGYGSSSGEVTFGNLADLMDLDPADTRYFDYGLTGTYDGHRGASRGASVDEVADALNGYLSGLSDGERELYLVGFSKGSVGIAELVARWDRGGAGPADAVTGAALLDPPMAAGIQGFVQSLGAKWALLPDDGGYDPVSCSWFSCRDERDHLGEASGVEVMVVRNPKAGITNFSDLPDGLRVYEAADRGPGFLETLLTNPIGLVGRVTEAHDAVLTDPRVADCITAEMAAPGTCGLPRAGVVPPSGLIVHGPGTPSGKLPINRML